MLPNFFEPVFMLIALGLGLGQYVARDSIGRPYAQFLVPGLLTVAVTNGAIFEVTYNIFVRLRHARVYDAVVTTPLEPQDVTLGELIWSLTRSA
ncbi:MAG: ABC transporter permease, partial [Actinomycetota bacterium]